MESANLPSDETVEFGSISAGQAAKGLGRFTVAITTEVVEEEALYVPGPGWQFIMG